MEAAPDPRDKKAFDAAADSDSDCSSDIDADPDVKESKDEPADEFDQVRASSLFDGFSSDSAEKVWDYMREKFGFDLTLLGRELKLGDYGRICLINYLRDLQNDNFFSNFETTISFIKSLNSRPQDWNNEKYLVPKNPEDPLLFVLPDGFEDQDDDSTVPDENLCATSQSTPSTGGSGVCLKCKQLANLLNEKIELPTEGIKSSREVDYFKSYSSLNIHREMILDKERTSTYANAIKHHLKDKVVLDVGCGTGILTILSAKAGAKLCVGVDNAPGIIDFATNLAKINNVSKNVIFISTKLEDCVLCYDEEGRVIAEKKENSKKLKKFEADVILSEWMGYGLLYESMILSVINARDNYLKPNGQILPSKAFLFMFTADCSAQIKQEFECWNECEMYGLNLSPLAPQNWRKNATVTPVPNTCVTSVQSAEILSLDMETVTEDFVLKQHCVDFSIETRAGVPTTSVGFYFQCNFGPSSDLVLDTSPWKPETHWKQLVCHLDPRVRLSGDDSSDETCLKGRVLLSMSSIKERRLDVTLEIQKKNKERVIDPFTLN